MTSQLPLTSHTTLGQVLHWRAELHPQRKAYIALERGEREAGSLSYAELDRQAQAIAAMLQSHDAVGKPVLLLYDTGLEFVSAFYGCLYAGAIAVPAPIPDAARLKRTLPRLQAIAVNAEAPLVLTTSAVIASIEPFFQAAPELRALSWVASDTIPEALANEWHPRAISGESPAFLQYTSGSTRTPRGVIISHANLLHNIGSFITSWDHAEQSCIVSWLPHFHDLGLVYGIAQAVYLGCTSVLMSPIDFVARPIRWLRAISHYKATHSMGPNFAFELCVRKTTPDERATLDLRSWRVAVDGAEPIREETVKRFIATFTPHGLPASTLCPGYGLAESTLVVSAKPTAEAQVFCSVDAAALEHERRVVEVPADHPAARPLVSSGRAIPETTIIIADPQTGRCCPPDMVGEIWVASPAVARGYWNQPEESRQTFQAYLADTGEGPFLRTGDLGFLRGQELFVTGRIKDMIIVRGQNYYPHDLEWTAQDSHPALRPGCSAVFALHEGDEERIVIVAEVEKGSLGQDGQRADYNAVIAAIRQAISEQHALDLYAIVLLSPGSLPKTSSGKIQRYASRNGYLDRSLNIIAEWHAAPPVTEDVPALPAGRSIEQIEEWLIARLAARLGIPESEIDARDPFASYGLNSVTAVALAAELEGAFGCPVAPTLLWDYPTAEKLAEYLFAQVST